ncbi:MAG: M16 family metallopeptidase, partial [Bradyrhizobium sp.]
MTHSLPLTRRIACLLVTCLAATISAVTPSLAMSRIQHIVSPGGIEAWFVQESAVPLISVQYAFVGGAAQDPPGKPGVGSLVSDLLDEGSGRLDSKAFHEALERRAIKMSFGVTRDYFRGSLLMLKDNEGAAFELLRTALTSPHFAPADVERIRAQVMSGLGRETTNPNALAVRKFLKLAYGNSAYGQPSSGTLKTVPTIT